MYMHFQFMDTEDNNFVTSDIYVNLLEEKVKVVNHCDDFLLCPFGVKLNPTLKDFNNFISTRVVPRTRPNAMELLRGVGIDFYDPLIIVMKIGGYQLSDKMDLRFIGYKEDVEVEQ